MCVCVCVCMYLNAPFFPVLYVCIYTDVDTDLYV